MQHRVWPFFLVIACVVCGAELRASADETPSQPATSGPVEQGRFLDIHFYWENDSRYFKPNDPSDRHYTNGVGLSFAWQPAWASQLAAWIPGAKNFNRHAVGVVLGQLMFTPEDISDPNPILSDRPYAGYLFAGFFLQRSNDRVFDHFQVELGVVGDASLAEDAQKAFHDLFDAVEPLGWGNQLKNEPEIQFYWRRKWRFSPWTPEEAPHGFNLRVVPEIGVALGTVYITAEGGVTFEAGFNLPDDFGPGRLANIGDATAGMASGKNGWSEFVFLRVTGRLVAHNMFLSGNNFHSSQSVDELPVVGECQFGFGIRYRHKGFQIDFSYSQTFSTDEFKGQVGGDSYGAYTLGIRFEF